MNNPAHKMPKRWVLGLVLLVIYAPYCWLIFMDYPWDSYRWQWMRMWPVLPGFVIYFLTAVCVPRSWLPQWTGASLYVLASVLTVLFLTGVIFGLLRLRRGFWPVVAGVFVLSCLFGLIAYSLMRA
jgi:hypothetical protein